MAAADRTAFRALSDVVLAIASEHEVAPMLQRLVHSARELSGARYAALGIPDGEHVIGLVHLGQAKGPDKPPPERQPLDAFRTYLD